MKFVRLYPVRFVFLAIMLLSVWFYSSIFVFMGQLLVREDVIVRSDVVVVLNTGVEIYPRLMESAKLYNAQFVKKVLINGNRKSMALKKLERLGYSPVVPWYANHVAVLLLLGVAREDIIIVDGEQAYDTVSEAMIVGTYLKTTDYKKIVITTSKYHSQRAGYIWHSQFAEDFTIRVQPASDDPFNIEGWWNDGRQIRWLMAEYGAWFFLLLKKSLKLR